jgi:hypothetical protein
VEEMSCSKWILNKKGPLAAVWVAAFRHVEALTWDQVASTKAICTGSLQAGMYTNDEGHSSAAGTARTPRYHPGATIDRCRWRLTVPPQRTEKGVAYVGVGERKRRRKKKKKRKGKKKEGNKIEKMNYLFLEIVIYNLY